MHNDIKLLIDGDILVYRMGFASQSKIDGQILSEPEANPKYLIKHFITDLMKKFDTTKYKVFLTADNKSNFRFKLAKTQPYKGNRDKSINPNAPGRPENYNMIREYLVDYWQAEVVEDIEADDALSIAQMKNINNKALRTIIVSIDKDLDMVPGWHYNFVTDSLYESNDPGILLLKDKNKKIYGTGIKWFYAQMLLGDRADNIPGIKGYGPVKVLTTLSTIENEADMWNEVRNIYFTYLTESAEKVYDRLYEVADLLWMQRIPNEKKSDFLRQLDKEYHA
jgi:5'-3' exonuclease